MNTSIRNPESFRDTIEKIDRLSQPVQWRRMNLKEGDNVFALTKATSASVEKA